MRAGRKSRLSEPAITAGPAPLLQRKCGCGMHTGAESCGGYAREQQGLLRAAVASGSQSSVPDAVHDALGAPGVPLTAAVRQDLEPRFGSDFSRVRVHADARAAAGARSVNALAFTVGDDIVFGAGRYEPAKPAGRRLLAHELAHVMQQREEPRLQRKGDDDLEMPEHGGLESEADEAADVALSEAGSSSAKGTKKPPKPRTPAKGKGGGAPKKAAADACGRRILSEGTCKDLALGSKWICCDPEAGFLREGRTTSPAEPDKTCASQKWTPIFTCDKNCATSRSKGCDDDDNWIAIPKTRQQVLAQCGRNYTICANGKQTTGYVRDKSVTTVSYEVSPGIQKALGVKVGDTFRGSVYQPGAKQATIDKDACCKGAP